MANEFLDAEEAEVVGVAAAAPEGDTHTGAMVVGSGPKTPMQIQVQAELEAAVLTARTNPRSLDKFRSDVLTMATKTKAVAQECFYLLPARGQGKPISGESIRMAEIIASAFGNLSFGSFIVGVDRDQGFVTVRGMCHDLEKNIRVSKDVIRQIVDKNGRVYSDNMIQVTAQAASSIAIRNAILSCVPKAYIADLKAKIREVANGQIKDLKATVQATLKHYLDVYGVDEKRLLNGIGKRSAEDITADDVQNLREFHTALKDGDAKVEDIFPEVSAAETVKEKYRKKKDEQKKEGGDAE